MTINMLRAIALLALISVAPLWAQGLPDQTWPAGTYLSHWDHGGRIVTYHNGYLYLGGTDNQHTTIYDISDPQNPALMHNFQVGNNGHTWHKIGNAFWRSYWNPELGGSDVPDPFADLSNMLAWQPFTGAVHDFPFQSPPLTWPGNWLPTYPHFFGNTIQDARLGWWPPVAERNLQAESGINGSNRWRLGNLLFFTPGDEQSGIAVFDIGDPINPVLLDTLTGNIRQYTNAWQIWRNYLVMMNGDNLNGPDGNANALVIDISDPTNLSIAFTIPYDDLPGRYVHFQDQYAFAGRFGHGTKYNMETMSVERVITPPENQFFGDFQWIPLGHLLLVSSSETNASRSYLFAHQDGLDTTPPSVGYHLPVDGATNQPVTTVIGLVINEVLDSTTVNDQTIQVRPTDGDPIAGVVIDSNYDVVNWVPVQPLLPDTTYEVRVIGGGIHDVAGNAIDEYVFHFSTGDELGVGEPIEVGNIVFSPDTPVASGQSINLSISASGGDGMLEYRWGPGDGTAAGDWQVSDQTSHVFAQPGTFTVQVQVRDQGIQLQTRTRRIVVNPAAGAARPSRSDSIVVDETNRRVWVVNPDHGSIARLGVDTLAFDFEQAICANPRSVALDAESRPWVACADDHRLLRLNPANGQMTLEVPTGRGTAPEAVIFAPDGQTGYASLAGSGEILRFDAETGTISDRIDVGPKPHALAVSSSGDRLLVSRLVSDNDDHGRVLELALPALTLNQTVELPIDTTSPDSGTAARGLPNYIASLALAPDDSRLFYVAKKDNILRGQWRESSDLNFETMVRVMLGSVDTLSGNELLGQRMDLDDSSMALALAPSPGGAHLFVALAGNHRIIAIDPWQGQELQRLDVGFTPRGLAIDESTGRLFVRNDLDRSVSVVDAAGLMDSGLAEMSEIDVIPTTVNEVLSPTVLNGKRVFWNAEDTRMGADGYMSCASCHLDGGGDGRTWDFTQQGEGLRRTIPLNGRAGLGQGFVHWSANFDEIQDFEIQIRNVFGGTGFVPAADYHPDPLGPPLAGLSADLDALAAYVASLDRFGESPYRQADGSLTPEGLAGQTIFSSLGCQGCHSGSAFSDSVQGLMHDVGTRAESSGQRLGSPLTGLDTPTLRGLWLGGPYLHDGRAADLHAVLIDHNHDDAHGAVSSLSSTDIDNLVAYLRQIDDDEGGHPDTSFSLNWQQPPHGQVFAENADIEMGVSADLAALERIEFLADGEIIGTRSSPPWAIAWTGNSGPVWLQARAVHGAGLTSLTRPVRVQFGVCGGSTGVLYQKWDGITGSAVSDLTSHPDFPDNPDQQWILNDLFEGPTNIDDNYGARLSGWLCAPDTGYYRFWIASDDNGSLRLSTNADPDDAVEIAWHSSWTLPGEWDKFSSQQSAQIWLEAGRSYWIEALMKEGAGGDNIAVGWQRPDGSLQRPISADHILRSPAAPPWNPDWLFRDRFDGASRGERGRGERGDGRGKKRQFP
jgi:large repetitive protein